MATMGELVVVLGLIGTATATTLPALQAGLDDARVAGAARYLSSRLADTRMDAVQRSREVALRFTLTNGRYAYTVYVDGNGNGVLSSDIQRGVDRPVLGPERLSDNFRNVEFGALPGLPPVDSGGTAPGSDPIRLGTGNSASFSALGTATSGTIYLTGPGRAQYAVRIFGATGKIRTYRYDWRGAHWIPL
jgi:type II secretory pathway pseudopilin PulG